MAHNSDSSIVNMDIANLQGGEATGEFYLSRSGLKDAAGYQGKYFTLNGIMMIICRDDSGGTVTIDGKAYSLKKGSVAILPENHILRLGEDSDLSDDGVLAVTMDFILDMPSPIDTNIFIYSRFSPVLSVSEEKLSDLWSYFDFIGKELLESGRHRQAIIKALIYALLLEITAEYEDRFHLGGTREIKSENLPDKFFRLLAANFRSQRSVSWYAGQLNLTPKYLSTAVKEITGRPVLDWIHEAVVIEAKMLLKTTDRTVQEISDHLCFSSASAFVQFFRKHSGTTPGAIR